MEAHFISTELGYPEGERTWNTKISEPKIMHLSIQPVFD